MEYQVETRCSGFGDVTRAERTIECRYCHKIGHMKKDCSKLAAKLSNIKLCGFWGGNDCSKGDCSRKNEVLNDTLLKSVPYSVKKQNIAPVTEMSSKSGIRKRQRVEKHDALRNLMSNNIDIDTQLETHSQGFIDQFNKTKNKSSFKFKFGNSKNCSIFDTNKFGNLMFEGLSRDSSHGNLFNFSKNAKNLASQEKAPQIVAS